jgi:hypothetical protein
MSALRPFLARVLLLAALLVGLAPGPALARSLSSDQIWWFHDHNVRADEEVNGNLIVMFGNATVAGKVHGDVVVLGGDLVTEPGYQIDGSVKNLPDLSLAAIAPWLVPSGLSPFASENRHLVVALAFGLANVLMFLIFPLRVRLALERVERHPGLSAAAGGLTVIAVVPLAVLLLLSIIGIPLIALEVAGVVAGACLGESAVALLVGRRLYELLLPKKTPSPLLALMIGLVVVKAAEIAPVVGWSVRAIVWLVGLGATILAFVRESSFRTFAGLPAAPHPAGGPQN